MTIVTTREELDAAQKAGVAEIIVIGELADKLKKSKKVSSLSVAGLAALTAVCGVVAVTIPFTGGGSAVGLVPVAAFTGMEVTAIITAATFGLGLILAIFKGYEEISFKNGEMVLRKRQSKDEVPEPPKPEARPAA